MDLSKLTTGDKVIGISAALLLIFSFFPWYGRSEGPYSVSHNGWSSFWGLLAILLTVALVVLIGLQRFSDVKLPELPMTWEQAYAIAAGVVGLFILLKLLLGDKYLGVLTLHRRLGIYLAFLAAIGLVVGAVLNLGEAPATGDEPAPPPPPPPAV